MRSKAAAFAVMIPIILTGLPRVASAGQEVALTPTDEAVVRATVANQLLFPDRAEFPLLRAATREAGALYICGFVSAIEGTGYRGPARSFTGMLLNNKFGQRVFWLASGPAMSIRDEQINAILCTRDGIGITAQELAVMTPPATPLAPAPKASKAARKLMDQADGLRRGCGGSEGADPTSTVCEKSIAAADKARAAGWCWGSKDDASMADAKWHRCTPRSY